MFKHAKNFLLGLAGLFGLSRQRAIESVPTPAPVIPKPRPTKHRYCGIEQILTCADQGKRTYMLNWGLSNLPNASADTRRKWAKAANDPTWRLHRRPAQATA